MYTKLFATLIHSTVWREEMHIKVVWITMLAMADEQGDVWASVPGLADAARVSVEQCEDALARLAAPDRYSRTRDHEGRRIATMEGGWRLLNYLKYRALHDADHRRALTRERVRRHRAKRNVTPGNAPKPHTEAEAEADTETTSTDTGHRSYPEAFERVWAVYPKRAGGNPKRSGFKAWTARLKGGASPDDMLAGVERYGRFCQATGKINTEYVMQAATFFGPDEPFREDWSPPLGDGKHDSLDALPGESPDEYMVRVGGGAPHG